MGAWRHVWSFFAFRNYSKGLVRFQIWKRDKPPCYRIAKSDKPFHSYVLDPKKKKKERLPAFYDGFDNENYEIHSKAGEVRWSYVTEFYAFESPIQGTARFSVQTKPAPTRYQVSPGPAIDGWRKIGIFYAYYCKDGAVHMEMGRGDSTITGQTKYVEPVSIYFSFLFSSSFCIC